MTVRRFISENIPFKGILKYLLKKSGLAFKEVEPTAHLKRALDIAGPVFYNRCLEEFALLGKLNMQQYQISCLLDIGGNVGQNTVSGRDYFDDSVPIYTFEPSDNCFSKLTQIAENFPNTHCIQAGAGEITEEKEFKVSHSSETSQASTFLEYSDFYKDQYPNQAVYSTTKCMVYALDDYFKEELDKLGNNIFLHIDTEGFDLYVLKGCKNLLKQTKVIILEVTYGLFEDEGSFDDIYQLLKNDFDFRGFLDAVTLSEEGQSLYQDALFVRKE